MAVTVQLLMVVVKDVGRMMVTPGAIMMVIVVVMMKVLEIELCGPQTNVLGRSGLQIAWTPSGPSVSVVSSVGV